MPRRDPHAVVDTVTDDPQRGSAGTAATTGGTIGRARRLAGTPASTSASCTSFEPPRPSGRNRSPGARGPHARPPAPTRSASAHGARPRPSGHATGGRVLDPRLDVDRAEPGPARAARAPTASTGVRGVGRRRRDARAGRRPARPGRRPGARPRARSPRATSSTASTVARRRRRRAEPLAHDAPGERAGQRRERGRVVGRVLGRERVEQLVVVAQHVGLPGEHLDEIAVARRARARASPRAAATRAGGAGRRSSDRAPAPRPSRAQISCVSARRSASSGRRTRPAPRGHAGQPGRAAPPQQLQQHRLGLVVARVPDEDRGRADLVARRARARRTARRAPALRGSRPRRRRPRSTRALGAEPRARRRATTRASCSVPARRP